MFAIEEKNTFSQRFLISASESCSHRYSCSIWRSRLFVSLILNFEESAIILVESNFQNSVSILNSDLNKRNYFHLEVPPSLISEIKTNCFSWLTASLPHISTSLPPISLPNSIILFLLSYTNKKNFSACDFLMSNNDFQAKFWLCLKMMSEHEKWYFTPEQSA